jgi:hypothetical protein
VSLPSIKKRFLLLFSAAVEAVGSFFDEAQARVALAFYVLMGWSPRPTENGRLWNKATETPILIHVKEWTDSRLLYTIVCWPATEHAEEDALQAHQHRVTGIMDAVAKGATEKMWSVQFEKDYSLRWAPQIGAWVARDGYLYHNSLKAEGGG